MPSRKITQYLGPPGNPGAQKREITFTTETAGSRSRLKTMTFLGRTWTYTYAASSESDKSLPTVLQPPVGRPWEFSYSTSGAVRNELLQLTTPNGGTVTWTYGTQGGGSGVLAPPFYLGSSMPVKSRVVTTRVSGGRDVPAGTRIYWYAQGAANNQTIITEPSILQRPGRRSLTEYTFLGVGDDYASGDVWKIGLLRQRRVKEGATVLETEDMVWRAPAGSDFLSPEDEFVGPNHDSDIYAPVVASRTITRGGQAYATTYTYHSQAYSASGPNFNDYGRPWRVVETGDGGTRTTERTFQYGFTPYIKDRVATETVTVGSQSFKRGWVYDLADGFLADTYDWGATATGGIHLAYTATAVGNVESVTDASGDTTTYTYDWGVRKNVRTPAYRRRHPSPGDQRGWHHPIGDAAPERERRRRLHDVVRVRRGDADEDRDPPGRRADQLRLRRRERRRKLVRQAHARDELPPDEPRRLRARVRDSQRRRRADRRRLRRV